MYLFKESKVQTEKFQEKTKYYLHILLEDRRS